MLLLTPPSALLGFRMTAINSRNDCQLPTQPLLPFHAHTRRRETHTATSQQMRPRKGSHVCTQQLNVLSDTRVCELKILNAFKKHKFTSFLSHASPSLLPSLSLSCPTPFFDFQFWCLQSLPSTRLLHKTTMTTL